MLSLPVLLDPFQRVQTYTLIELQLQIARIDMGGCENNQHTGHSAALVIDADLNRPH
jgi:hypothetical protein